MLGPLRPGLTDDGLRQFVYAAWNRLRKVNLVVASTETTIAAYEYYGHNRRSRKTVAYRGQEVVANDGGDTEVRFYYDNRWRILETRNGSGQTTFQHLWGPGGAGILPVGYVDEIIWIEKNGDPSIGDDTTPDVEATGESTEDPADARYFVHQDRNWTVVALTYYKTDPNDPLAGAVAERYEQGFPLRGAAILTGALGANELGAARLASPAGNLFAGQRLPIDRRSSGYQNGRPDAAHFGRFSQRDPLSSDPYLVEAGCCTDFYDAGGIWSSFGGGWCWEHPLISGPLHPNQLCFRQTTCGAPGCHVCIDLETFQCTGHVDSVSPACSSAQNGLCTYCLGPVCFHIINDVLF
jgi:hypothetical protein